MAQNFGNLNKDLFGDCLFVGGAQIVDNKRNVKNINSLSVKTDARIKGDLTVDGSIKTKTVVDPKTYDNIICGAGSAASLIASQLANGGKQVLMLEMGPNKLLERNVQYGYTLPAVITNDPDLNTPFYLNPIVNDPNQTSVASAAFLANNNYYSKNYPSKQNGSQPTYTAVGSLKDNLLTVTSTNGILVPGMLLTGTGVADNTQIVRQLNQVPITFATGNGTTVTYNCSNNFTAGQGVIVTGVNPGAYNLGTATTPAVIASASATQFTITNAATGTYVSGGTALQTVGVAITGVTTNAVDVTGAVADGTTIVYSAPGHTFTAGQSVTITGMTPTGYNFTGAVIDSVVAGTSFTLVSTVNPGAFVSGGFSGTTITYNTATAHGLFPLCLVTMSQITGATQYNFNAQTVATVPSATSFTISTCVTTAGSPSGGVLTVVSGGAGVYKVNTAQTLASTVFTCGTRYFNYTTGFGWGGGGNHYYQNAFRMTPFMCDSLARASGSTQWEYNSLLAANIFQKIEAYTAYPGDIVNTNGERGLTGQMSIIQLASTAQIAADTNVTRIASALGLPLIDDCHVSTNTIGVAPHQLYSKLPYYVSVASGTTPQNITGTYRSFPFDAYLKLGTVLDQNGNGLSGRKIKVTENTTVDKILFTGTTATGVQWVDNATGLVHQANVVAGTGKVILCAAPTGNVPILQRSGVGPAALLTGLGIPVVVNSPRVGKNLLNHNNGGSCNMGASANGAIVAQFTNPSGRFALLTDLRGLSGEAPGSQFYYPADGIRRSFIPARNASTTQVQITGGTVTSNPNGTIEIRSVDPYDNPAIDWKLFADDLTGATNYISNAVTGLVATGTTVTFTSAGHPFSVGMYVYITGVPTSIYNLFHVQITATTSNTFTVASTVTAATIGSLSATAFRDGSDMNKTMTFLKLARQAATNTGLTLVVPPPAAFANNAVLAQQCILNTQIQSHASCACALGTNITNGVVDANLNVFGTTNLMIADSSVFANIPDSNFLAGVMVIAAKACEFLGVPL